MLRLDHLVVGARDLEEGRAWMAARLGAAAQAGGAHPGRGTHNALWRLGAAYLEVLAPDPDQAEPAGPRMFGLDLPEIRARVADEPALIAWVAAPDDLDAALARGAADFGRAEAMSRGDLSWRLTITETGRPPLDGALPALIGWPAGVHPAERMPEAGLRLARFTIRAPAPERVAKALAALGGDGLAEIASGPPGLVAEIATPAGTVRLD